MDSEPGPFRDGGVMARDVLIEEAIKRRLRPFAVAAARKAARRGGLGELTRGQIIESAIETAARAALAGMLPDAGEMSARQFQNELMQIYEIELQGLGDLGEMHGWLKKAVSSVRRLGSSIEDRAKDIGRKIDDVNRKIIREVVLPVTAPTIAHNLDKRDDYKAKAYAAWLRYEASGRTDAAALQEYEQFTIMANKRLDKVQDTVKAAAAVVGAVVVGPVVASALKGGTAAVTEVAGPAAVTAVKEKATEAAIAAVIDAAVEEMKPQAIEAAQQYQDAKAELFEGEMPAGQVQKSSGAAGLLLPVAAAALTAFTFG